MYSFATLLALEEEKNFYKHRAVRRSLRDNCNPLEMPNNLFHQYYRVTKDVFKYLVDVLDGVLPATRNSFAMQPIVKVGACLRFFAEGPYQKGVGNDNRVGLAQSSFSCVLAEVLNVLEEKLCPECCSCWLLGNAGYPLEPWLLTPYRTATESKQRRFNDTHSKCRNIIERTNGVLKNRWRCISGARELHYSPKKAVQIVKVAAALHNICIHFKSVIDTPLIDALQVESYEGEEVQADETYKHIAQRIRDDIVEGLSHSIY